MFGCSRRTTERRIQHYGIPRINERYSCTSDTDLKETVTTIVLNNPNLGEQVIEKHVAVNDICRHNISINLHSHPSIRLE